MTHLSKPILFHASPLESLSLMIIHDFFSLEPVWRPKIPHMFQNCRRIERSQFCDSFETYDNFFRCRTAHTYRSIQAFPGGVKTFSPIHHDPHHTPLASCDLSLG